MLNLTDIISKLQSDKVKARQEAIGLLEEAFIGNNTLINALGTSTKEWQAVLRALFAAVYLEKAACSKKGFDKATAASLARLEKAGSTVRNITRRCVGNLSKKVVKDLLYHLIETMVHRGQLVSSLSLNYVKSILEICSYKPHLEHLTTEMWLSLCSLAFAAILGDSLREPRGFGNDTSEEISDDAEMEVDLDQEASDVPSGSRKRKRNPSPPARPGPSSGFHPEPSHTASAEQIDFMTLLVILLRSPYAPYASPGVSQKILNRLHRFFVKFSAWGNAHQSAVVATNIVLEQVELNSKNSVADFAVKMWPLLLSHWAVTRKSKPAKEEITLTMTTLLPFITLHEVVDIAKNRVRERIDELYTCLEDDLRHSSGFEGLSMDSLQLHLHDLDTQKDAFEARSFRSGFAFGPSQALSWATLELHADCIKSLHVYAEKIGSPVKRRKLETPISELLTCIRNMSMSAKIRSYQLQVLLFVVDRHWAIFHESLQQAISSALIEILSPEEPLVQSWSFLCLAAIASTNGTAFNGSIDWDAIWSHSVRRTNVFNVCRAASHAAHILLASQRLPVHRVLTDIEGFSNDLVVQGPTFPYDSVCAFLCSCLHVASQDMRLHRLQLPDRVLSWVFENWSMAGPTRSTMPAHTVADVLSLLEATCGFSKTSEVTCRPTMPDCVVVEAAIERHRTAVFREYILHSSLPPFRPPISSSSQAATTSDVSVDSTALSPPTPREIKVSNFLFKSLDLLCIDWQNIKDLRSDSKPERVRRSLDAAVISLCFEASLVRNGSHYNRRVVQLACKLIETITPCLELSRWNAQEHALILMGLEPLVFEDAHHEDDPWDLMPGPVEGSGLKRSILVQLASVLQSNASVSPSPHKELQRIVWQSADVQDTFQGVMKALRNALRAFSNAGSWKGAAKSTDQDEGFTPAVVVPATHVQEFRGLRQRCVEVCMTVLAAGPVLQSETHNATRDKELTDFLLNCDPFIFLDLAPEFFQVVRKKQMHISLSTAEKFKDRIHELMTNSYAFTMGVAVQMIAIQFMHSTSHLWMQPSAFTSELANGVRLFNAWFSSMILEGNIESWRIRDRLICFLDHHATMDPLETFWTLSGTNENNKDDQMLLDEDKLPSIILPKMADDVDTRVRFRVAVANARLLYKTDVTQVDPMVIYAKIKNELSRQSDKWEHMLTRFVHLGNAMVASSAVRRGPYWHLLEVSLYSTSYTDAIGAVLSGVASRLGFPDFRILFEVYASQLVNSVILNHKDIFALPPGLLGYENRLQCAQSTFPLLAPVILQEFEGPHGSESRDEALFEGHCQKAQKSVSEGMFECFADIVGTRIVQWVEERFDIVLGGLAPDSSEYLLHQIRQFRNLAGDNSTESNPLTKQGLDRIVFAILKTVCDIDHSSGGTIAQALKSNGRSDRAVLIFMGLSIYRRPTDFKMHHPNLPAFSALTVLRSLGWLSEKVDGVFGAPVIYHVMHHLFAAIGSSMLVNEQMRLLQGLSIWISINGSSFKDVTLLRTLISGTVILLAQYDLAHFAQGILEWAFNHYASLGSLEPRFPDILGRITRIAHDYSRDIGDPASAGLGNELMDWIEKQAWTLSKSTLIKDQILKALPLWPRHPIGPLAQLAQELHESQPLSDILQNQHVVSGKFRLVRRLRDMAASNLYAHEQFSKQDFWNLKSCIPPHDEMQDEDIDAFVDVLSQTSAQIVPLSEDIVSSTSAANLHKKRQADGRKNPRGAGSPRGPIALSLLDILSTDVPSQIHRAYTTLRLILALSIPELTNQAWNPEFRGEISYLRSCPLPTLVAPPRSLTELQSSKFAVSVEFPRWVCEVSLLFSDVLAGGDAFYAQLSSSIQSDPFFAAQVLPVLVHGILSFQHDENRRLLSDYFRTILLEDEVSTQTRKMVVDIVLHLRSFVPPPTDPEDPLAYDKWLDLDFRLLSQGAMSCGAYTTALLFLELATDYSESSPGADSTAEEILYQIYSHIEEPDGFYAIKSHDIRGFLTRRFHHEGQWDKAFQFHGADYAAGFRGGLGEGILQSLHSNGFDQLAMAVLQSTNSESGTNTNSSQLAYQIAWRTELWDLPDPPANRESALYTALRAVHRDRDPQAVDMLLKNALRREMSRLRATGIEDMVGIRERARTLICLGEIKKWRGDAVQVNITQQDITSKEWEYFSAISPEFDFITLEGVIATRMSLLRSTKQREQREQIGDMESPFVSGLKSLERRCLVRLSEAARLSDNHQIALNAIIHAQRLQKSPTFEVSQEFANVLWLQKEHKLAVEYLKALVPGNAQLGINDEDTTKHALILSRLGTWSAEACLQKPTEIREQYFHRATASILDDGGQKVSARMSKTLAVIFHQYALFAEDQYHAILRSPEVSRLKLYVERKKEEIKQIQESLGRTQQDTPQHKQLSQYWDAAKQLHGEDVAQFSVHTEARSAFLIQAIEMYSRCLQTSDEFDDSAVIRLCSLWFANFNDEHIQESIGNSIERVPSRKFIFLAHQLTARLSKPEAGTDLAKNQQNLQTLILRMCNEHPFHSLYQVWALQEGSDINRRRSLRASTPTHLGRARAAADIFTLCKNHPKHGPRVQEIDRLCQAYLEWAKHPLKSTLSQNEIKQGGPHAVPMSLKIRKISHLRIPVTTAQTPLDYSLLYENTVNIQAYAKTFSLAGGLNLPKIIDCIGSDGLKYKQLFKGEGSDDLRQDAVMEQVFELVNVLLKRDRQTRKRHLSVRGYKVIPLASQAGLLEFVQNTMPIGTWLVDAHKRYRPMDHKSGTCHNAMMGYRDKHKIVDPVALRDIFVKLFLRFQPVFRHFFTEKNKHPTAWFSTRLMYARSAATTSIVGHVLGLGDRHVSNILIDHRTGELVHIDLGIAFDQGKRLGVPELVPFRLTADMVDGLGSAGTEGVFRRCAEETLRVLRAESGVITTVLEVFRHDPLYSWTASAFKLGRAQGTTNVPIVGTAVTTFGLGIDMESDAVDESADRALTSVHRKLDKSLSIEYTVNELIVSARDITNLSLIFPGWSPWL